MTLQRRLAIAVLAIGAAACADSNAEPPHVASDVKPAGALPSASSSPSVPIAPAESPPPPAQPPPTAGPSLPASAYSRCPGACTGNPPDNLKMQLTARATTTKRCYDALLARDATRTGDVVLTLKYSEAGEYCGLVVERDEIQDADFMQCALTALAEPLTPAPVGGCIEVRMPLIYKPRAKQTSSGTTPPVPKVR